MPRLQRRVVYPKNAEYYKLVVCESTIIQTKVTSSKDVYNFALQIWNQYENIEVYESFYILMLNQANVIKGFQKISQGGVSSSIVDTKLIAKYAIDSLATAIILLHNHPADPLPSQQDKEVTRTVKKVLDLFQIRLLDHLILSRYNYFSFLDEGILPK